MLSFIMFLRFLKPKDTLERWFSQGVGKVKTIFLTIPRFFYVYVVLITAIFKWIHVLTMSVSISNTVNIDS